MTLLEFLVLLERPTLSSERVKTTTVKYVLQRHDAYKAGPHYDFRIQIPTNRSQLESFVIRIDEVPKKVKDKTYVVRTQLHSKTWLNIQRMEIPAGEYGGGLVTTKQSGEAIIYEFSEKKIVFSLRGKILDGKFVLVNLGIDRNAFAGNRHNPRRRRAEIWLLIKVG